MFGILPTNHNPNPVLKGTYKHPLFVFCGQANMVKSSIYGLATKQIQILLTKGCTPKSKVIDIFVHLCLNIFPAPMGLSSQESWQHWQISSFSRWKWGLWIDEGWKCDSVQNAGALVGGSSLTNILGTWTAQKLIDGGLTSIPGFHEKGENLSAPHKDDRLWGSHWKANMALFRSLGLDV